MSKIFARLRRATFTILPRAAPLLSFCPKSTPGRAFSVLTQIGRTFRIPLDYDHTTTLRVCIRLPAMAWTMVCGSWERKNRDDSIGYAEVQSPSCKPTPAGARTSRADRQLDVPAELPQLSLALPQLPLFLHLRLYDPGGSHARQFVSASPFVEVIPSGPVVHFTERSQGAPPITPPVHGTCEGGPPRTARCLLRNSSL